MLVVLVDLVKWCSLDRRLGAKRRCASRILRSAVALLALTGDALAAGVTAPHEISLRWDAASGPVSYYGVWIYGPEGIPGEAPDFLTPAGRPELRFVGEPGAAYRVRVAAFRASGERGPLSPESDLIPVAPESGGNGSIRVAWSPAAGPVSSYGVWVYPPGSETSPAPDFLTLADDLELRLVGEPSADYRVRVAAYDSRGARGPWSPESEVVHFAGPPDQTSEDALTTPPEGSTSIEEATAPSAGSEASAESGADDLASDGAEAPSEDSTSAPPDPANPRPYDFDGDGFTDALWLDPAARELHAWMMTPQGPERIQRFGVLGAGLGVLGSADFDRDGDADVLLDLPEGGGPVVWFVDGAAPVEMVPVERTSPDGASWHVASVGDFDGDGVADELLLYQPGTDEVEIARIARSDPSGETPGEAVLVAADPGVDDSGSSLAAPERTGRPYDFDGDGRSDALWQVVSGTDAEASRVLEVWFMTGAGPRGSARLGELAEGFEITGSGDLDGDGHADLLVSDVENLAFEIWLLDAQGVREKLSLEPSDLADAAWSTVALGDFDGDAASYELLLAESETGRIELGWIESGGEHAGGFVLGTRVIEGTAPGAWRLVSP